MKKVTLVAAAVAALISGSTLAATTDTATHTMSTSVAASCTVTVDGSSATTIAADGIAVFAKFDISSNISSTAVVYTVTTDMEEVGSGFTAYENMDASFPNGDSGKVVDRGISSTSDVVGAGAVSQQVELSIPLADASTIKPSSSYTTTVTADVDCS